MYIRSSEEDGSSLAVEEVEGVLSVEEEEEEAVAAAVAAEEEEEVVAAVVAVVAVEEEEEEEEVVDAVAAVEEEEEEPALGFENTVELVAAAVEEEDAVAACVVAVEGWLGAPKSSMRRLLTRLLLCMVLVYFPLPGMFQLEKTLEKKSHLRRSYLNDASNENAVSALLFIHFSGKPV